MGNQVQELETELAAAVDVVHRIDLMNALAQRLRESNLGRSIALSEQACALATEGDRTEAPYQQGYASALLNLGECYVRLANYDLALSFLFKSLPIFESAGDAQGRAMALNAAGVVHLRCGNYADALEYLLQALDVLDSVGNEAWQAAELSTIGRVYLELRDYARALTYLLKGLHIVEQIGEPGRQAEILDAICVAYFHLNDPDQALEFGLKSVALYREMEQQQGEAVALTSLGDIYYAQADREQAMRCFQQALEIAQENGIRYQAVELMLRIGNVHLGQGEIDVAIPVLEEALTTAQEIGTKRSLYQTHHALAQAYKQKSEPAKALAHYEAFHTIKESVFDEEADVRLKNLGLVYQAQAARREAEASDALNEALQREIVEREKAQEALQEVNARLSEEIKAREQLISDLDAFAHSVAHDMKTPLTIIGGYSDVIQRRLQRRAAIEPEIAELAEFTEPMIRMCNKAGRIVDELLILATVRRQDVDLQLVDMAAVIAEVEERMAQMIDQAKAEIVKPATWPLALGHGPWLEEVWYNYISNAIKYGGTPPHVELGATPQDDGFVCFWVRDNGSGVSSDARDRLFSAFSRLDQVRAEGHGLGLSIVKRIVEKLGGEVSVESEGLPGQGSTFGFTLKKG